MKRDKKDNGGETHRIGILLRPEMKARIYSARIYLARWFSATSK